MSNPKSYTVGWICAITTEYVAAQAFLDNEHRRPKELSPRDNNDYVLGDIHGHNVVIAVLPDGEYGTSSAATVARDMLHSFPNIRISLMVGIGGGVPNQKSDIRLGDIVVSSSLGGAQSVFQYDFGRTVQGESFYTTGYLSEPPTILRTAVSGLKAQYERRGHQLEEAIQNVLDKNKRMRRNYTRPDLDSDRLYHSQVLHPRDKEAGCEECCGNDPRKLVIRSERTEDDDRPMVHYGCIASGNQLMKDALVRDKLAAENGVLCFEMEAAGLMNHFPCLVIRGICDYADSHKNKAWQGYAAMAAAAYAKDLLYRIVPLQVEGERCIWDILSLSKSNTSSHEKMSC
jgi:nucleoside phosphorylase